MFLKILVSIFSIFVFIKNVSFSKYENDVNKNLLGSLSIMLVSFVSVVFLNVVLFFIDYWHIWGRGCFVSILTHLGTELFCFNFDTFGDGVVWHINQRWQKLKLCKSRKIINHGVQSAQLGTFKHNW